MGLVLPFVAPPRKEPYRFEITLPSVAKTLTVEVEGPNVTCGAIIDQVITCNQPAIKW